MIDDSERLNTIYGLLGSRRNVLLSGPPGVGKSRLLAQVVASFIAAKPNQASVDVNAAIALPRHEAGASTVDALILKDISEARVFWSSFDQNTKHADFVRGIVPRIGDTMGFKVSSGVLYQAAEFARQPGCAALVVVDEINRGPAVSIFGNAMVALEPDKRTDKNDQKTPSTQEFPVLDDDGELGNYSLPPRLYIVAAMNQADSSVEPMDVAFLRRFAPFPLEPSLSDAAHHFGVPVNGPLPASPATAADVNAALVRAWSVVNARIRSGRGTAYQLGHGILMGEEAPTSFESANAFASETWSLMYAHLQEVFFGDTRGLAEALGSNLPKPAFELKEGYFGGQPVVEIRRVNDDASIYELLLGIGGVKSDEA